jgi:hypothetical protein
MSQIPLRSVRLNARPATTLQSFVGTAGEIFYDSTNQTLRVYPGNIAAGKILADRDWVNSVGVINYNNLTNRPTLFSGNYADLSNKPILFSGSYADLTNKPVIPESYSFSVSADDSTQRLISTDEVIKFVGAGGITTASDAEGNITITGTIPSSLVNGANTVSLESDGELTVPGPISGLGNNKLEFTANLGTVFSGSNGNTISIYANDGDIGSSADINIYTDTAGSSYKWTFDTDGNLAIPGNIKSEGNINIDINLSDSTLRRWQFGEDGALTFPDGTNQSTAFTGIPGPYADDEAAALAGVALGSPYHKTGTNGQVFVRLTSPT